MKYLNRITIILAGLILPGIVALGQISGALEKKETIFLDALLSASLELEKVEDQFIVLDKSKSKVYIFSEQGKVIVSFGKKGRGPGEMMSPVSLHANKDFIFIFDRTLSRVTIFNFAGEIVNSFSVPKSAIDMHADNENIYLYNPFRNDGFSISKINITTGEFIRDFGHTSPVHYQLKAGLATTFFQGVEIIDGKLYVLSHPYDLSVSVFDLNGELVNTFDPENNIYDKPEIPNSFNPFTDRDKISDYVSLAVVRFRSYDGKLFLVLSDFKSGDMYMDILREDGTSVLNSLLNIGKARPHTIGSDGTFYELSLLDEEGKIGIISYYLDIY
jgi:hypothetical protein